MSHSHELFDAHCHVWDSTKILYPWLADGPAPLAEPHLPTDIDDADGQITGWLFVEADAAPGHGLSETAWVSALPWPGLRGIVAKLDVDVEVDAMIADAQAQLEYPLVRAFRPSLQMRAPGFLGSDVMRQAADLIEQHGLPLDICVRWDQIAEVTDLAASFPHLTIVLDHLGKPPIARGPESAEGRQWLVACDALSQNANVVVKCSGLAAEAAAYGVSIDRARPFVATVRSLFGAERCMFGSDWPVSGARSTGSSVGDWIDLLRDEFTSSECASLFGLVAQRVYRTE